MRGLAGHRPEADRRNDPKPARRKARGKRRVTMMDVAREANCSQSTVSFVINDTPDVQISQATRERVLKAARKIGYGTARQQPTEKTQAASGHSEPLPLLDGTIAFVIDHLSTSPEAVVSIEGTRNAAWKHGNIVLAAHTLNDPEMEPRTLKMFLDQKVDALIYASIFTREVVVPACLYETAIPVFLLNCYSADHAFPAVVPGEIAGGHRATTHLIRQGHTRIAMITGEIWMDAAKDRLKGYRRALASADIPFDPDLVFNGDWSASGGYDATQKLLDLDQPPTAIFCQNDRSAVGCYEALKERGVHIPKDMSVVGYDDEEISRHLIPALTTSVLPHLEMGEWAVEQMHGEPRSQQTRHPVTKLECPLIERESVAAPRSTKPEAG